MSSVDSEVSRLLSAVRARDPNQSEFLESVSEVISSLRPLFVKEPKYLGVISTICEPDRAIQFRVPWQADDGSWQVNRGFRVQFNNTVGPYKGGLRLHPSVNLSIVKFLGFEQIFKNALTGLPIGGGKGGSDFNPKGKSDGEVLRFCQSFMTELSRYIGADTDVPAGDIGVGAREIGFLYGQYKRLTSLHTGVLTGKGQSYGGSATRPEATGFGTVYITEIALQSVFDQKIAGKRVAISGSGNVALFAAAKLLDLKAKVISLSDSSGSLIFSNDSGMSKAQLAEIDEIKAKRGRLSTFKCGGSAVYYAGVRPWLKLKSVDIVLPCATQNEVNAAEAEALVRAGAKAVAEGANMPCEPEAIAVLKRSKVIYLPGKAANAGGVAVSQLEMAQNSGRTRWSFAEVDSKLKAIMTHIFNSINDTANELGCPNDFQLGANAAGFKIVADSMLEQGSVFIPDRRLDLAKAAAAGGVAGSMREDSKVESEVSGAHAASKSIDDSAIIAASLSGSRA